MNRTTHLLAAVSLVGTALLAHPLSARAQDVITPPMPIGNARLVLVAANADTIYAVTIVVDVDASGKADLTTLQLSGSAAELNGDAIRTWLRTTRFQPAKRNGVPFRARFRMTAEALKQVDPDDPEPQ